MSSAIGRAVPGALSDVYRIHAGSHISTPIWVLFPLPRAVRAAMAGGSSGTDGYTRIMGRAEATAEQMGVYLKAKNPEAQPLTTYLKRGSIQAFFSPSMEA